MIDCAVAKFVHEGKSLLIQRALDDAHFPGTWCLPGGKIEEDKNSRQALGREVGEELNWTVNHHRLISLGKVSNEQWETEVFEYRGDISPRTSHMM